MEKKIILEKHSNIQKGWAFLAMLVNNLYGFTDNYIDKHILPKGVISEKNREDFENLLLISLKLLIKQKYEVLFNVPQKDLVVPKKILEEDMKYIDNTIEYIISKYNLIDPNYILAIVMCGKYTFETDDTFSCVNYDKRTKHGKKLRNIEKGWACINMLSCNINGYTDNYVKQVIKEGFFKEKDKEEIYSEIQNGAKFFVALHFSNLFAETSTQEMADLTGFEDCLDMMISEYGFIDPHLLVSVGKNTDFTQEVDHD